MDLAGLLHLVDQYHLLIPMGLAVLVDLSHLEYPIHLVHLGYPVDQFRLEDQYRLYHLCRPSHLAHLEYLARPMDLEVRGYPVRPIRPVRLVDQLDQYHPYRLCLLFHQLDLAGLADQCLP